MDEGVNVLPPPACVSPDSMEWNSIQLIDHSH